MAELKRIITHWTGGGGRASSVDLEAYHFVTEFDGNIVEGNETPEDNIVTSDGDYAAHTRNLNTGSIGTAMAGMRDAIEYPLSFGPSPITRVQFEAHCKHLAELHHAYGIPVTRETCLTHAEVEPTLGVKQNGKWDITVLQFEPTIRGALPVGDYLRSRVMSYMSVQPESTNRPTLRNGDRGLLVQDLQTQLQDLGYFVGRIDGIFGPRTRDSVLSFQATEGLGTDGVVGPRTWAALKTASPRRKRPVDEAELRAEGSQTIKQANRAELVAGAGGAVATIGAVTDAVGGAADAAQEAEGVLQTVQSLLLTYWPTLAIIGGCIAIWWIARKIKEARVKDAQTGANMRL